MTKAEIVTEIAKTTGIDRGSFHPKIYTGERVRYPLAQNTNGYLNT